MCRSGLLTGVFSNTMITKKICLLGSFSVGKTSLVEQYVHSIFSDKYLSSVGVKISKKTVSVKGREVNLVLWDMEGKDMYAEINLSYLRGAMGYFVVVDGTRLESLDVGKALHAQAVTKVGDIPCFFLINKADIADQWEVTQDMLQKVEESGIHVLRTSAKTGLGVDEAFLALAEKMCAPKS